MRNWSRVHLAAQPHGPDRLHQDRFARSGGTCARTTISGRSRFGSATCRRACDHVLGLTALIQCLVYDLSEEIDRGTYQYDCHPFMVRQNKWRACRYGMEASLVDPHTFRPFRRTGRSSPARSTRGPGRRSWAAPTYLELVRELAEQPTGSVRQLADLPPRPETSPRSSRRMLKLSHLADQSDCDLTRGAADIPQACQCFTCSSPSFTIQDTGSFTWNHRNKQ